MPKRTIYGTGTKTYRYELAYDVGIRHVYTHRNIFRKGFEAEGGAWGWDLETLEAWGDACTTLQVHDHEDGVIYEVDRETMDKKGKLINYPPHGPQLALGLSWWEIVEEINE